MKHVRRICAVLLAAGFCGAGFIPGENPWFFYGVFSVPVGLGCAFLYPSVMSCAQKWYADRKGLATGVIGGAVGASGAVLTRPIEGASLARTCHIVWHRNKYLSPSLKLLIGLIREE